MDSCSNCCIYIYIYIYIYPLNCPSGQGKGKFSFVVITWFTSLNECTKTTYNLHMQCFFFYCENFYLPQTTFLCNWWRGEQFYSQHPHYNRLLHIWSDLTKYGTIWLNADLVWKVQTLPVWLLIVVCNLVLYGRVSVDDFCISGTGKHII